MNVKDPSFVLQNPRHSGFPQCFDPYLKIRYLFSVWPQSRLKKYNLTNSAIPTI